jgi:hypothetical protein
MLASQHHHNLSVTVVEALVYSRSNTAANACHR